jgi:hypothetical protein
MTRMGLHSTPGEVLRHPRGREALERLLTSDALEAADRWRDSPMSIPLLVAGVPLRTREALAAELRQITRPDDGHLPAVPPNLEYEPGHAPRGSADVNAPTTGVVNEMIEVRLTGPQHGNPFVEVDLWADFRSGSGAHCRVGGFYDGEGRYVVRFLPPEVGHWAFITGSTARSLDGIEGSVAVEPGTARGPVRIHSDRTFRHSDGTSYVAIGTTAYAWTHQSEEMEEQTLDTLSAAPFTKIRMGVFPKSYDYNSNEPRWFPFEKEDDGFDLTRFNPEYFRHLERRLRDLDERGIEADLILFHPYDRWGFADLGPAIDERYLTYVVRRLAAFPNVWWSMANEYDLVSSKDLDDWNRLAEVVRREDHVGHLLSIHNGVQLFDYAVDWATHASIQRNEDVRSTEAAVELRERWGKPVVFDEMGYEGDLENEWGNVPPVEVVRQFWEGFIGGGHVTHGETYWNKDENLFWSKGGRLVGEAPARIAFLARIIAESPTGRLDPISSGIAGKRAGVTGRYEVHYLGLAQPRRVTIQLPDGIRAHVDVLDTWNMTVETLPGLHGGTVEVELPVVPFLAIRWRAVIDGV